MYTTPLKSDGISRSLPGLYTKDLVPAKGTHKVSQLKNYVLTRGAQLLLPSLSMDGNRRVIQVHIGIEFKATVAQPLRSAFQPIVRGEGCVRWTTSLRFGDCTAIT